MGTFLTFLLVFILASQVLAFAIALIARSWVWVTEPVVLHGIDLTRAGELVAAHIESVHDTRFGFPTGVFRVQEDESAPTRVVAREVNFQGSQGFRLAKYGLAIPAAFVAAAADEGCAAGLLALAAGVFVAVFFVVPIMVIAVVEVVLRWLMRSRITAILEPVDGEDSACSVRFELAGLSAFGVRRGLTGGLSRPVLPTAWGGTASDSLPEPWHHDRLNVVYASGSALAALAAILIVSLGSHGGSGSSSQVGYVTPQNPAAGAEETTTTASTEATDSETTNTETTGNEPTSNEPTGNEPTGNETTGNETTGAGTTDSNTTSTETSNETSGDETTNTSTGISGSGATTSSTTSGTEAGADQPPSAADADLAAKAAQGTDYTVRRPSGQWVRDYFELHKPGYIETRWHLAGHPDVIFLIDHTPGSSGTARESAESISGLFKHVRAYRKLSFAARALPAGDGWRWEYEDGPAHSVDTFLVSCGTGFAVRGSAPAGVWPSYRQSFEDATATLTPACG